MCFSGGFFGLPGYLTTSDYKEALVRPAPDSNKQRGREKHARKDITVKKRL